MSKVETNVILDNQTIDCSTVFANVEEVYGTYFKNINIVKYVDQTCDVAAVTSNGVVLVLSHGGSWIPIITSVSGNTSDPSKIVQYTGQFHARGEFLGDVCTKLLEDWNENEDYYSDMISS